jgi:imidazolonepropionase-like amidohydrolase
MVTLIRADYLFDGKNPGLVRDGAVAYEGNRIVWAGAFEAAGFTDNEFEVIERPGETVMPGMINSHSHPSIIPELGDQTGQLCEPPVRQAFRATRNMRKELLSGVTTLRVMGEENYLDIEMNRAIGEGIIPGPRLICSGIMLCASDAHGRAVTATDGPDEVRRRVRENLARGAEVIKIFVTGGVSTKGTILDHCTYDREEIGAACEEAHRAGARVAAHAHGGKGVRMCLECGVDTIEHAGLVTPEDVAEANRRGTWLVGTFSVLFHPAGIESGDAGVPEIMDKLATARRLTASAWSAILKSGGRYALGTDGMHGMMWYEAERLVAMGATNEQALLAVTGRGAECCGVGNVGTLEPGKIADIITVRGNPLEDIGVLSQVGLVIKDGERFEHISVR